MKRLLSFFLIILFLSSCSELALIQTFHGKENKWSEIKKEELPVAVIESFVYRYPNSIIEKSYKLKNNKYIVCFQNENKKRYSLLTENGIFNNEFLNDMEEMFSYDDFDDYIDSDYYE